MALQNDVEACEKDLQKVTGSQHSQHSNAPENYDTTAVRSLVWKQDLRIIPLTAGIYLLCFLDRSNIGNAKTLNANAGESLLQEANMTNYQYTIALMVFLVAYAVFEVPSNYFLKKLKPSRWIAFLMFGWGACTIGLGGANNYATVTAVRFLLASATLAGAFGGAIAYGVGHMKQVQGLSAWRWLFILEGIPSCVSSVAVWLFLPDYPEEASWLSTSERELAVARLEKEGSKGDAPSLNWETAKATLLDGRLWVHYIIYFGISAPFSSLSLFTPTITAGLGYENLQAQLMTVPPYAVAYVVSIVTAWSSDYFNARALHSAVLATIGAIGFLASALLPAESFHARYGCLIVAASGAFSCIPPLLGWLSNNMHSTAAAGLAIALNVSWGAPGQIVGVWIYKANEKERGYPTGHWTNFGMLVMVAVGCVGLRFYYQWRNKRLQRLGPDATGMDREFSY
ncbi:hypothetical protein J4E93_010979 [Alternaria ventricosa]|uniref:uncharacterized protein n=1 Tax=Alternaria ventricosa TaxID=1187951 RepID=UPI0020C3CAF0|nr:uncharacterized protein J4E93_010979 [Alternaria ventricosa]KAI4636754.1 hypothetical protein J4E93_010979 [Alternaria ventricosa]